MTIEIFPKHEEAQEIIYGEVSKYFKFEADKISIRVKLKRRQQPLLRMLLTIILNLDEGVDYDSFIR